MGMIIECNVYNTIFNFLKKSVMCKHRNNQSTHTCSGFYGNQTIYCCHCIWELYTNNTVVEINFDEHNDRIRDANLIYPIFLSTDYMIIDGCHRVLKAHGLQHKTINAIFLSHDELQMCLF